MCRRLVGCRRLVLWVCGCQRLVGCECQKLVGCVWVLKACSVCVEGL